MANQNCAIGLVIGQCEGAVLDIDTLPSNQRFRIIDLVEELFEGKTFMCEKHANNLGKNNYEYPANLSIDENVVQAGAFLCSGGKAKKYKDITSFRLILLTR